MTSKKLCLRNCTVNKTDQLPLRLTLISGVLSASRELANMDS